MRKKLGIPRGMFYYDYFVLWEEFFNKLGVDLIVSPETNKDILNRGINTCVDEACLPVKVFHGHVDYLKDKVDYLFIPKFISIYRKEYCCPKHLGLPDMVKHSIKGLPEIIDIKIDLKKSNRSLGKAIIETGKYFTNDFMSILQAYNSARKKYRQDIKLTHKGIVPIYGIDFNENNHLQILVLGHSYNIYDPYISMNIVKKLDRDGIGVLTGEMVEAETSRYHSSKLSKRMFWSHGQKIVGGAFALLEEEIIDGIIYISSFGCGMDSVLMDLVERKAKTHGIPFTLLTIDEQTGEAGINTRIEAFLDMLEWRDKNENNLSTYG